MKGITTIASLPGSGSGCQSALPAEKPVERALPAFADSTKGWAQAPNGEWVEAEAPIRTPEEEKQYERELGRAEVLSLDDAARSFNCGSLKTSDEAVIQRAAELRAEEASISIRGFGRVDVVEYRVGEPAPWEATHESWHYCGPDGRMYQARGLQKPAAQILADVDEFNIPFQRFMIQTPHEWRGAVFSPPPDEVWEIALYDSGVARLIGVHPKTTPADLLDVAGGGE